MREPLNYALFCITSQFQSKCSDFVTTASVFFRFERKIKCLKHSCLTAAPALRFFAFYATLGNHFLVWEPFERFQSIAKVLEEANLVKRFFTTYDINDTIMLGFFFQNTIKSFSLNYFRDFSNTVFTSSDHTNIFVGDRLH